MRSTVLLLSLFSAAASLSAQQAVLAASSASGNCPVGFGAEVNGRAIAYAAGDARRDPNTPLLELTFRPLPSEPRDSLKVVSASVTVHGCTADSRVLPVSRRANGSAIQSFAVKEAAGLRTSEVSLTEVPLVDWAEITELRFADGSAWHPSADAQCRATPSKFRLVESSAR